MIIRRLPEDFLVEELPEETFVSRLGGAPAPGGGHAVFWLTKKSLTTPEAVTMLSNALGVRAGMIVYAGLKDKHAVTGQFVTVRAESDRAAAGMPARVEKGGMRAESRGWSANAIEVGDIRGNRFEVVVRNGGEDQMGEMDRRAALLGCGAGRVLFVNYFGDQRFGSARHGQGWVATRLIKGEFEEALRLAIATPARKDTGARRAFTRELINAWGQWAEVLPRLPRCPQRAAIEALVAGRDFRAAFASLPNFEQRMFIDAYQSHLWNETARRLVLRLSAEWPPESVGRVEEGFGEMLFPAAAVVPDTLRRVVLPVFGPNTKLQAPWKDAAEETLRAEGITVHDLRVPGLRRPDFGEAPRGLFAEAAGFGLDPPTADELFADRLQRTVRFELPRGAYATVLLRALGQGESE